VNIGYWYKQSRSTSLAQDFPWIIDGTSTLDLHGDLRSDSSLIIYFLIFRIVSYTHCLMIKFGISRSILTKEPALLKLYIIFWSCHVTWQKFYLLYRNCQNCDTKEPRDNCDISILMQTYFLMNQDDKIHYFGWIVCYIYNLRFYRDPTRPMAQSIASGKILIINKAISNALQHHEIPPIIWMM
jgi:hypothetical protein